MAAAEYYNGDGLSETALVSLAFDIVIAPSAEAALEAEDLYYRLKKKLTADKGQCFLEANDALKNTGTRRERGSVGLNVATPAARGDTGRQNRAADSRRPQRQSHPRSRADRPERATKPQVRTAVRHGARPRRSQQHRDENGAS